MCLRHSLLYLVLAFLQARPAYAADEAPPSSLQLEAYNDDLRSLEKDLRRDLAQLRESYRAALLRLKAEAVESKNLTLELWAARNLRKTAAAPYAWTDLLHETLPLPKPLDGVHAVLRKRCLDLAGGMQKDLVETRMRTSHRLEEEVRSLTRKGQIEDAMTTREEVGHLEEVPRFRSLSVELEALVGISAREDGTFKGLSLLDPSAPVLLLPPGAKIVFRSNNPAFQRFSRHVHLESAGHYAGGYSRIGVGSALVMEGGRGMAVVGIEGRNVVLRDTYDTYASAAESKRFAEDIRQIPYGTLILVAVNEEATRRFTGPAQAALHRLGARIGLHQQPYRSSYILVGLKGLKPGEAIEAISEQKVTFPESRGSGS